jgi:hypothetical protein
MNNFVFFFQFQTHGNNKVKSITKKPMSMGLVKNTSKNNWKKNPLHSKKCAKLEVEALN